MKSSMSAVAVKFNDKSHLSRNLIPTDSGSNYWIDRRRYGANGEIAIEGPVVLRAKNKPAFIWQVSSIHDSKLDSHVPYLIVIEDTNSMQLLTDFRFGTLPWRAGVSCTGFFQGNGFSGRFCHTYEVINNEELLASNTAVKEIQEAFGFETTDGEKNFNLEKGRIFLVSKANGNKRFEVEQLGLDMPSEETVNSPTRMDGSAEKCYRDFEKWWAESKEKLANKDKAKVRGAVSGKTKVRGTVSENEQ